MLQLTPLDETAPIFRQLGADMSPVILVNVLRVADCVGQCQSAQNTKLARLAA